MQVENGVDSPNNKDSTLFGPETSAKENLEKTLEYMKSALDDISKRVKKFCCPSVEAGTKVREEDIYMNGSAIVKDLVVLEGSLEEK